MPFYTFWGAMTVSMGDAAQKAERFHLGVLSLEGRRRLEQLALQIPVYLPNGVFNCQSWTVELLWHAVAAEIFDTNSVSAAIRGASN